MAGQRFGGRQEPGLELPLRKDHREWHVGPRRLRALQERRAEPRRAVIVSIQQDKDASGSARTSPSPSTIDAIVTVGTDIGHASAS
jgi:hypothetical protein